jgi:hypothetical protein
MAVNYGLGGFKNGSAYYGGRSGGGAIPTTTLNEFVPIDIVLSTESSLNVSVVSDYKLQVNLQGFYYVKYSITSSEASGADFTAGISINEGAPETAGRTQFNSKQGDEYTSNSSTIVKIQGTDTITIVVANNSDEEAITIDNFNITLIRIGDLAIQNQNFLSGNSFIALHYSGTDAFGYAAQDTFYKIDYTLTTINQQQIENPDNNIKILQEGFYLIDWSISTTGSSNDDFTIALMKNGETNTDVLSYPQQRFNSKGGSLFQSGFQCLLQLKKDDTIAFAIANNTDTTGTTKFRQNNIVAIRLGNI